MTRVIVLGAGLIGSLIARDLAEDPAFAVTSVDARPAALARVAGANSRIEVRQLDLSAPGAVGAAVKGYDLVCGALASHLGFRALREIIEAGVNYCDISFMPESALELDALAKERGVTAVVDCGVAPGMSNLLAGCAAHRLNPCDNIEIYVGGLPRVRKWPFQYKAGFSPADVLEEYTRPARYVVNGEIVVREALSEPELIELPGVDTLEAFNTDGLRSIAETLNVPNMKEKTLRYPGHIELMRVFRETGLFSKDAIEIHGVRVRPIDVTSALLFPKWTFEQGEADFTVMRVLADGVRHGSSMRLMWDVLDEYDSTAGNTSMARTTAFPCAIVARLIAEGRIQKHGVLPPEMLGNDEALVESILSELAKRGVQYRYSEQPR